MYILTFSLGVGAACSAHFILRDGTIFVLNGSHCETRKSIHQTPVHILKLTVYIRPQYTFRNSQYISDLSTHSETHSIYQTPVHIQKLTVYIRPQYTF
jgi:hypothetical protein